MSTATKYREKKEKILKHLQISKNARADYESQTDGWEKAYSNYMSKVDTTVARHQANFFVGKSFEVVETFVPLILSNAPKLAPKRVRNGTPQQAQVSTALTEYWMGMAENMSKMEDWVRGAGIYGTGWIKTFWNYEQRERVIRKAIPNPENPMEPMLVPIPVPDITSDAPAFDTLDIWNVWVDPRARHVQESDWIIEHKIMSKEDIERLIDEGVYEPEPGFKMKDLTETMINVDTSIWNSDKIGSGHTDDRNGISVYEYWTKDGQWHVTLDNKLFLRYGDNPHDHGRYPYLALRVNRPPNEFYGRGLLLPIRSEQEELNFLRSVRADNYNISVHNMFKVKEGSPADEFDFVWKPGGKVVYEDDPGEIDQFNVRDNTFTAVQEAGILENDIKNLLGIHEYIQGANEPGMNKTATGVAAMQNAAMARIKSSVRNLGLELGRMAELFHGMAKQYMETPAPITIMDETALVQQDVIVYPQDIQCDIDFDVHEGSTSPVNGMMRMQNAQTVLNLLSMPNIANTLAMNGEKVNVRWFVNLILESMEIKNKDQAIVQMNPMEQQMVMNSVMQQMMAGQLPSGNNNTGGTK